MKIDISKTSPQELVNLSKEYGEGYVKSVAGKTYWFTADKCNFCGTTKDLREYTDIPLGDTDVDGFVCNWCAEELNL